MIRLITLTALALLGLCGAAFAQIGKGGGPIDVSADSLDIDRDARIATYVAGQSGVVAIQGDAKLRSHKLTLYFAPRRSAAPQSGSSIDNSFGDLVKAVAEDEVFYLTPREQASGDLGTYLKETDTITLEAAPGKRVQLVQGDDVAEGVRLTINLTSGRSTLFGDQSAPGGRIRTIINPKDANPDSSAKPAEPGQTATPGDKASTPAAPKP